jgi:hypothetical protein
MPLYPGFNFSIDMLACCRMAQCERQPEPEISSDPDNTPPRSRLFIVVPKQADPQQIQVRWHCGLCALVR